MTELGDHLSEDEVAVIPVDPERGLALVLGGAVLDAESWQIPRGMIDSAITAGGLFGGAVAAKDLLDGSLVRLAPQTLARIKEGAYFSKDAEGFRLGTLREVGKRGFTDQVRFIEGAANPAAAGLLLQTMAVQMQLKQIQEKGGLQLVAVDSRCCGCSKTPWRSPLPKKLARATGLVPR